MESTWDFLLALGLDETAGVRDVRRAYARRLKAIDPAGDPAGFQALREAYETALDWAEYRERERAEEQEDQDQAVGQAASAPSLVKPAPPIVEVAVPADTSSEQVLAASTPPAPLPQPVQDREPAREPEPAPADEEEHEHAYAQPEEAPLSPADAAASAVFARLGEQAGRMAGDGRLGDPQAWLAALLACLGDAELESIAARSLFEGRIVHLLASGWRAGNEALFPAAVAAFEWGEDRRRLAQFGYMGAWLNQAIDERALFDTQPPVARGVQERIAALLRRPAPASAREIHDLMDELDNIELRFPALLAVVADASKVEDWRRLHAEQRVDEAPPGQSKREKLARIYLWLLLLIVVFILLRALYNSLTPAPARVPVQPDQPVIEASAPPASYSELVQPYLAPVLYTPQAQARLTVSYEVYLLDDGSVNATDMLDPSSGDPAFDMAVAQAILDARSFPPELPRIFRVTVTAAGAAPPGRQGGRPKKPAAAVVLPVDVTQAPDDDGPPVRFQKSI